MSVSSSEILLKVEVKARLRYRSDSSFYEFFEERGKRLSYALQGWRPQLLVS